MSLGPPTVILAVCLGNVCRSPLAEHLLRMRLDTGGVPPRFTVASAGVIGMVGRPMHPQTAHELRQRGGEPDDFRARRLDEQMVTTADLVLTATVDVRRQVLEEVPRALRRTFTLLEFAALCSVAGVEPGGHPRDLIADAAARRATVGGRELDIPDPMGRSERTHARVADVIDGAVDTIAAAFAARG